MDNYGENHADQYTEQRIGKICHNINKPFFLCHWSHCGAHGGQSDKEDTKTCDNLSEAFDVVGFSKHQESNTHKGNNRSIF